MTYFYLAVMALLVQYTFFSGLVAHARVALNVPAPAMHGPERFDRLSRVHLNTQERLVLLLPLMAISAQLGYPLVAAGAGVLFGIGRHLYWRSYLADPARRMAGNVVSMLATGVALVTSLVGVVRTMS